MGYFKHFTSETSFINSDFVISNDINKKGYGMFNTYFQLGKDFIKNKL